MAFTRGLDPKLAMGTGNSMKLKIARVLEHIYNDYQKFKVIDHLSMKYGEDLSPAYFRKIIGSQVIERMTKSKKNMHYKWNAGDNPDFFALADKVLAYSSRTPAKTIKPNLAPIYTSKLSVLLFRSGVDEDKIPTLTQEIVKIFLPEGDL